MRGAQFSATLTDEKCSDLRGEQASTGIPCQGGFALVLATLSCAARMEEIACGAARPQNL